LKEKTHSVRYKSYSKDDLPLNHIELIEKAKGASKDAYAPYSKFHVGASILLENGDILVANNQENAAFPSGLCAERVVLFHKGANFPKETIKAMAIYAPSQQLVSPCGSCRQVMVESEKRNGEPIKLIISSNNREVIEFKAFSDILPFPFVEF
jgi:cytidine deaminase